ncbi:hypothetical protein LCGC14_0627750 [marine sediment metagenome]|uniref:Uncharacterized protein n=1 Tax=marine sediment metagenome TaxID=412755 RepID=A0A0F9R2U2_9ZZZZ
MEAKDTVMTDDEIRKKFKQETGDGRTYEEYANQLGIHLQDAINIARYGAIAQAEITFTVGEESVLLESKMGTLTVSSLVDRGKWWRGCLKDVLMLPVISLQTRGCVLTAVIPN